MENLNFINHPDFSSLFEVWFKAQFPRKRMLSTKKLNFTGNTNRSPASLTMVSGGLGVTILPEHCASDLIQTKRLIQSKKFKPATGTIYIIHRSEVVLPRRVKKVINTFLGFYNKTI